MEPSWRPGVVGDASVGSTTLRARLVVLAGSGALFTGLLAIAAAPPRALQANPFTPCPWADTDGDGLADVLEQRIGSDLQLVDTDCDGYFDGDEYFLSTNPAVNEPITPVAATRVFGFRENDDPANPVFRLGVGLFLPDGDPTWVANLSFVAMKDGAMVDLKPFVVSDPTGWIVLPGGLPGSLQVQLSFAVPQSALAALVPFTFGSASFKGGNIALDGVHFDTVGSVFGYFEMQSTAAGADAAFRPLDPAGLPSNWGSLGEACVLTMESGGNSGIYVVVEVTGAGCESFAGGYCEAGACAAKQGEVHEILDVLGLIGTGD